LVSSFPLNNDTVDNFIQERFEQGLQAGHFQR